MAENICTDLNLSESARPRVQQVTNVQGKSCCSRSHVTVLVAVLVVINLLQFIVLCRIIMYHPNVSSAQDSTTLPKVPEEKLACPKQWEKHGTKCYFFSPSTRKDWNASRKQCTAMDSDLVIIDNKEELHYLMEKSEANFYFLGLTYSEREQKWKWINNVEHDPALFKISGRYLDYHCTAIGLRVVHTASCGGSPTTANMCEKAATISAR